ncbi:hypothetical protein ACROYT_G018655 [Oculina patagonica]
MDTAKGILEDYDGTRKDSLMQTKIALKEKMKTLRRLDDTILDLVSAEEDGEATIAAEIDKSEKIKAVIRGVVLAIEEKLRENLANAAPPTSQTVPSPPPKTEKAKARLPKLELKVNGVRYWLDSKTALSWIQNKGEWKQFVRHRVNEILKLSSREEWLYCPTEENPADIGSRGAIASQLKEDELWWHGPQWVSEKPQDWPKITETLRTPESSEEEEKKSSMVMLTETKQTTGIATVVNANKYSTLHRLVTVTAWVIRFVDNLRPPGCSNNGDDIDLSEEEEEEDRTPSYQPQVNPSRNPERTAKQPMDGENRKRKPDENLYTLEAKIQRTEESIKKLKVHLENKTCPKSLRYSARANIPPDEQFKRDVQTVEQGFISALTRFNYRRLEKQKTKLRKGKGKTFRKGTPERGNKHESKEKPLSADISVKSLASILGINPENVPTLLSTLKEAVNNKDVKKYKCLFTECFNTANTITDNENKRKGKTMITKKQIKPKSAMSAENYRPLLLQTIKRGL